MARTERFGVLGTETAGVFFTEAAVPGADLLGEVTQSSNRQNTPLTELKERLAHDVLRRGGNALVRFSYAQKGTIWSFSSTRLTASGVAARLRD